MNSSTVYIMSINCTEWAEQCTNVSYLSSAEKSILVDRINMGIAFILIIISPIIIFVNALVVLSVVIFRNLRQHTNYLLCSLAFADLLVGTITCPLHIAFYLGPRTLYYNRIACLIWLGSVILGCGASLCNLLLIAVDRFIAVAIPFFHFKLKNFRRKYLILIALWTFALLLSVLPLLGWNQFEENKKCDFDTTLPKEYVYLVAYGVVGGCILLSSGLYLKIFLIIWHRSNNDARRRSSFKCGNKASGFQREVTFTKITAFVFLVFIVFWAPYFFVFPLKYSSLRHDVLESVNNLALLLAFTNSMINPLVYVYVRPDFKIAFKLLLTTPVTKWPSLFSCKINKVYSSSIKGKSTPSDDSGRKRSGSQPKSTAWTVKR